MTRGMDSLIEIMARLRDRESGCPWDIEQTYRTIAPHTIEEAYEVVDAIESGDFDALKDELGDLLFHVVYYSQFAREDGLFDFEDVAEAVCEKMIRRHPHVFGDVAVFGSKAQTDNWEATKAVERHKKSVANGGSAPSAIDGVIDGLPALTRAMKLQNRAARVGFDWGRARDVIAKIREEAGEIEEAIDNDAPRDAVIAEVGDLLFTCVNLARKLEIEPETALRQGNRKFETRFRGMERHLSEQALAPKQASLEQMDDAWEAAKREE